MFFRGAYFPACIFLIYESGILGHPLCHILFASLIGYVFIPLVHITRTTFSLIVCKMKEETLIKASLVFDAERKIAILSLLILFYRNPKTNDHKLSNSRLSTNQPSNVRYHFKKFKFELPFYITGIQRKCR